MPSDEGYLVLPSNTISDTYPNNTNASYTCQLAGRLELEASSHEVALIEVTYNNSWHNVSKGVVTVERLEVNGSTRAFSIPLGVGHYESIEELLERLSAAVLSFSLDKAITVSYNRVRNSTRLTVHHARYSVSFSKDLAWILGFTPEKKYAQGVYDNMTLPDIDGGIANLYIYSDIVSNRDVGNALAPLLRVVPLEGRPDANVQKEFVHPHYVPASNIRKDAITVNITTDDGTLMPFAGGKVSLTVHYRRRQA